MDRILASELKALPAKLAIEATPAYERWDRYKRSQIFADIAVLPSQCSGRVSLRPKCCRLQPF